MSVPEASKRGASGEFREGGEPEVPASRPGAAHRGGPYLLLVPLLLAAATIWWVRRSDGTGVPTRPPARVDPESTHEVLGGELARAGAQLAFWLAPWEVDPQRQAFQARALRTRYDLEAGEPWRLRLEWRASETNANQEPEAVAGIDAALLSIEDEHGRALQPLRLARPMDPLAALLAPPVQPLVPGTSLDLCLWGRAPGPSAHLVGPPSAAGLLDAPLTARPLRRGDRVGPMASLDPAAAKSQGKIAPSEASATAVRERDDPRY